MTRPPIRKVSIHFLSKKAELDFRAIARDLRTTSDRAAAIIGGGLVEWTIETARFVARRKSR